MNDTPFAGTLLGHASTSGATMCETAHPPRTALPRHAHAQPSFCLVTRGGFRETWQGGTREVGTSDVIYRPLGEWHTDHFHDRGARCFNLELAPALLPAGTQLPMQSRAVTALLHALRKEVGGEHCPLVVEGLVLQLIGEAFHRSSSARRTPAWLETARRQIRERFTEHMTAASIAAEIGVHPVHFARAFREEFGTTVGSTIRDLRINYARELLHGSLPLVDVALAAGFADQSHFTKTFRRLVGVTPNVYRSSRER